MKLVKIFDLKKDSWYRNNGRGWTKKPEEAGLFNKIEAQLIHRDSKIINGFNGDPRRATVRIVA